MLYLGMQLNSCMRVATYPTPALLVPWCVHDCYVTACESHVESMGSCVNLRSSCRGHNATTSCTHILHYPGIKGKHACAFACKTVDLQQL